MAGDEPDEEDHTYLNLTAATYDIPRSMAANIYDQPRSNQQVQADTGDYDYPKGLIPLSARLLLNASRQNLSQIDDDEEDDDDREEECDADSLDGRPSPTGKPIRITRETRRQQTVSKSGAASRSMPSNAWFVEPGRINR